MIARVTVTVPPRPVTAMFGGLGWPGVNMELVLFLFCVGGIAALLAVLVGRWPGETTPAADSGRPRETAESGWTEPADGKGRLSAKTGRAGPVAVRDDRG